MAVHFESCKIAVIGRELRSVVGPDGKQHYAVSPEMIRRANEAGMYWRANTNNVESVVCTGGYPGAALGMPQPPEGINEGVLLKRYLVGMWGLPAHKVMVEGKSCDTFENFSESIALGFLRPGEFSAGRPLVLSANEPHMLRLGMLATHILQIPEGGLFRLRPGAIEGPEYYAKELALAKMTLLAIEQAVTPPGDPHYTLHIRDKFRQLWRSADRPRLLEQFDADRGASWLPSQVPLLDYPQLAIPGAY